MDIITDYFDPQTKKTVSPIITLIENHQEKHRIEPWLKSIKDKKINDHDYIKAIEDKVLLENNLNNSNKIQQKSRL